MKLTCPENSCQNQTLFQKDGHYFRKSDSKFIQRYRCKVCGKKTSTAQLSPCYGQKKRTVNHLVEALLCSKVSQRRIAKILKVDKKTVHRKVIFLGIQAAKFNQKFRDSLTQKKIEHIQIDDMITKEVTKLKPVTITSAVDAGTRKILALQAAPIPAFGHIAKIAVKKYGRRKSEHKEALQKLFEKLHPIVEADALIRSDKHSFYPEFVQRYFPRAEHQRFDSIKGCIAGQGELKKTSKDPLYSINHTFAMMRDNVNRFVRRSWCVTQSLEMLQHHLEIYIKYHNTQLV